MLGILLDENVPVGVKGLLAGFQTRTAGEMGWVGITNGKLLDAAEAAGFQIMITADQNISAQQRLVGRKIALVVITTNHWDTIRDNAGPVISACSGAGEGTYNVVSLPRPLRRRRPFEPSGS